MNHPSAEDPNLSSPARHAAPKTKPHLSPREKWADARERGRQLREADAARTRRYAKIGQLRALGVSVPTGIGELDPSLTEEALDAMLAAEKNSRSELYETFVQAGTIITFRAIGVQILQGGDGVYTVGDHNHWEKTNSSRLLGPLAGAEARVTDGTSAFSVGKAMLMPLATAPLARKETADAMVVFADGIVHSVALDGSSAVRQAPEGVRGIQRTSWCRGPSGPGERG